MERPASYRPTTRVLTVLELLQTHERMSGPELARRLGVDPRTARRYITQLEALGIPITAERGRNGAYALVAGFKLPPMMFTEDEALAVAVGLLAARDLGLASAAPAVASAQAKLERVMPATLRHRVRAVDETVALDLARATPSADNAALVTLTEAARERRRVRMRYRAAAGEVTEREFDPYGLAYRGGCWYVVGHCHLRLGLRSFRLDRVVTAAAGESRFERPADFDALEHLTFAFATIPRAFGVELLLETDLATARAQHAHTLGALETVARGVRLRGQVDDLAWLARELSRWSFEFRILRPAALRVALRDHARTLRARAARGRSR
ncbi:MAG: YafY family transcriptional regulator [Candidatus Eisenbacteria bacterium]|uniref:YafY family transcriptional regulator n=1 Tax=Eiseniibacteriota bacterium TaxID=2212470 RepID=A0A849SPC6_UNCEI|nr:YafY family transcriptional regulator [Candidatus Eisenbacteria bacterium]